MRTAVSRSTIHCETVGDGHPVLILHGGYLDHRHMADALEPVFRARSGWRRLYMDIPGHGRSSVDKSVVSQTAVFEQILEFVDTVLPGQRFSVAGESRGGYLARGIVRQRPQQVEGALFIVPGRYAQARPGSVPDHRTLVPAPDVASELSGEEAARFARLVVQNRQILDKIRQLKMPATALADATHLSSIERSYELEFDVDQPARPFEKPVLFLLGRQDSMVGFEDALRVAEQFPRGTFAVLDRAGHSLAWEQPLLFEALVGEWLDRVEEARRP